MPKVKYDVTDVEDQGEFTPAPVGLYRAKIASFETGATGDSSKVPGQPMGVIRFTLTHDSQGKKIKPSTYGDVWHRIPLDNENPGWTPRLKEFIKAVGLKAKGAFDPDKLEGVVLVIKLKTGKDQDDEYRPEVAKLMQYSEASEDDSDDDEDDDDDTASDDDDDDDSDDDDDETYTEEELSELSAADLREVAGEYEVTVPKGALKGPKKAKLIAAILEAQEEAEDDDEDDDDEDDDNGYDEMSKTELVKEARSRGIKIKKGMKEGDIIALLEESDNEEDDDDDEDDDDEDGTDYEEMAVPDLKAALKERGLKATGSKAQLVARLEKDDEAKGDDDGDPF